MGWRELTYEQKRHLIEGMTEISPKAYFEMYGDVFDDDKFSDLESSMEDFAKQCREALMAMI